MIHSKFKSYKNLRYPHPEIFTVLCDNVIEKIEKNEYDEMLYCYAINRLAFMNCKEDCKRLVDFVKSEGLINQIAHPQNIVMVLHALSI